MTSYETVNSIRINRQLHATSRRFVLQATVWAGSRSSGVFSLQTGLFCRFLLQSDFFLSWLFGFVSAEVSPVDRDAVCRRGAVGSNLEWNAGMRHSVFVRVNVCVGGLKKSAEFRCSTRLRTRRSIREFASRTNFKEEFHSGRRWASRKPTPGKRKASSLHEPAGFSSLARFSSLLATNAMLWLTC